ncbi:MAG TPA: nucleotide exchange factor GrpE [Actinomycetes bacterium]
MQNDTDKQAREDSERSGAPEPDKLTPADMADEPDATEPEAAEPAGQEAEGSEAAEATGEPGDGDDAVGAAGQDVVEEDPALPERADEEDEEDVEAVMTAEVEEDAIAADLAKARDEAESYLDDLRRLQADFENYRKRTLREQTARTASASQALVARLLPVLDNFERAVSAAEQSRDFDGMLKGVEMVLGALREVLEGEGLVKIEAEGKPFDPERHEAVIAVEQEDSEPGMVVEIVRAGYELGGKVLRPAMVKVAK